jgi:hypothetical protein
LGAGAGNRIGAIGVNRRTKMTPIGLQI